MKRITDHITSPGLMAMLIAASLWWVVLTVYIVADGFVVIKNMNANQVLADQKDLKRIRDRR